MTVAMIRPVADQAWGYAVHRDPERPEIPRVVGDSCCPITGIAHPMTATPKVFRTDIGGRWESLEDRGYPLIGA